jgi:hypothetical protein
MLINAFDLVENNNNNVILSCNKKLYTNSIPFKPFYSIVKRYNTEGKKDEFYILMADDCSNDSVSWHSTNNLRTQIAINLKHSWKIISPYIKDSTQNCDIEYVDKDSTCEVYKLIL